jgi:hypothetical protein
LATHISTVMAGLIWQPEIGPMAYTITNIVKPKVKVMPV